MKKLNNIIKYEKSGIGSGIVVDNSVCKQKENAIWIAGEDAWNSEVRDCDMIEDALEEFGTKDEWIKCRIEEWTARAKEEPKEPTTRVCKYNFLKGVSYMDCGWNTSLNARNWEHCPKCGGKLVAFAKETPSALALGVCQKGRKSDVGNRI